jgi:hypothetical protein
MKKVNLTKYGFVRWPERDFSDDGNRFTCYRVGKAVEVSKLISNGQIYLSIDSNCGNRTLPYEMYSKLPFYQEAVGSYNGISVETLTDADIQTFYEACIEYENAYLEEEAHLVYPTIEELTERCEQLKTKAIIEYTVAQKLTTDAILLNKFIKLSDYQVKEVKNCLLKLKEAIEGFNPKTYPQSIFKSAYSFRFIDPNFYDLVNENYWLRSIKEIFVNI